LADPIFFFSYARADRKGAVTDRLNAQDRGQSNSVDTFYQNLCDQVAALTGRPAEEVGFFDSQNLELGAPWPERLMDGLRSAHVMVALFSPTYFRRRACGREFEVFRRRHESLSRSLGRKADDRILPVLWVRPDVIDRSIPGCCRVHITNLQWTAPGVPEAYTKLGLMRMIELDKIVDSNAVCHSVADRIYDLMNAELLPRLDTLDFNTLQSAFDETLAAGALRPIDRTKREIRTYYLVPTRTEWLEAAGANAQEFSDQREKARPFAEALGATVSSATEEGVAEVKPDLVVVHEELPNNLDQALADAKGSMTSPLLVFDRRAVKIPHLRMAGVSYSGRNFAYTGFVTVAGHEVTDSEVGAVFNAKIGALPKLHNWTVPADRSSYVRNVASIVAELEAQLVRRDSDKLDDSGEAIPGLSGPNVG
jgi:hypothetical protein